MRLMLNRINRRVNAINPAALQFTDLNRLFPALHSSEDVKLTEQLLFPLCALMSVEECCNMSRVLH